MSKITTVLFDFDGVVANTEPLYDIFWGRVAEEYQLNIPDFPACIKGTTLQNIFDKYFSDYTEEQCREIEQASVDFELEMEFPEVPGSVAFLGDLKAGGYRLGLVTSSPSSKMKKALRKLGLEAMFDTIVTADRITCGKPDPMCYLLAARDLQTQPGECVVFEDAFAGIQAGTSAGMRVIGLSTTNPADSIRDKVFAVIPDFENKREILQLLG